MESTRMQAADAASKLNNINRTRNGCVTCKRRRVRCDEAKPTCGNCERFGAPCEGYRIPAPVVKRRAASSFRGFRHTFTPAEVPRMPVSVRPPSVAESGRPAFAFDFFVAHTVPIWTQQCHLEDWPNMLFFLQQSEPVLHKCCLAVGALHASLATLHTSDAESVRSQQRFVLQQYSHALKALRTSIQSNKMSQVEILLACTLLAIFESVQGRRAAMLTHLRSGLDLALQHMSDSGLESNTRPVVALLFRLGMSDAMYGRPRLDDTPEMRILSEETVAYNLSGGEKYCNLRVELNGISRLVLGHIRLVGRGQFKSEFEASCARTHLENSLKKWRAKYDDFAQQASEATVPSQAAPAKNKLGLLLMAQFELASMYLNTCGRAPTINRQIAYDKEQARFARILDHIEEFVESMQLPPSKQGPQSARQQALRVFSVELGLIPILFTTCVQCRHPAMRRRALGLLQRVPRREGVWNTETALQVSRIVHKIEDQGSAVSENPDQGFGIPEERRVQQIFEIRDGSLGQPRQVTLAHRLRPGTTELTYTSFDL